MNPLLVGVSRAVVGAGHVTACVVLVVVFFASGGAWVPGALAVAAGVSAWRLLRDDPEAA